MKQLLPIISVLLSTTILSGQQLIRKKIKDVKVQAKVTNVSVDRLGGFYTVGDCGIEQFDPEGKFVKSYNYLDCNSTELLEAWLYVRIYAYQNYKQQFTIFNSHLEEIDKLDIDPSFAVEPHLATISTDLRHYWILDMDNSVKRVNLKTKSVDIESDAVKTVHGKFLHIREYQNMLFLLHENSGVYVLDQLGKLAFQVPVEKTNYFSFSGEDLYFLKDNKVYFFDIFTRDTYTIDVAEGFKFVIATDEKLILIKDGRAEIFEFSPRK
jgi:hypothetical protein